MKKLNIALVAHDARKQELIDWVAYNTDFLKNHNLYATGTTAKLISKIQYVVREHYIEGFVDSNRDLQVIPLLSGPLGGDQQIGAMIAEGKIDVLIFFCDNLITQGHQQDVGALSRLASLYNIAFATNRTTADMIITSPLCTDNTYNRIIPTVINNYKNRQL
jgi:methylglyoxal synthase